MIKKNMYFLKTLKKCFSTNTNYYKILEISENSSLKEIKKAYMKKVRSQHPDIIGKNEKNEEEFKKILKAYSILKNPIKKELYDLNKNSEDINLDKKMYDNNKFYQNRWYNYKKPQNDMRFEYSVFEEKKYFFQKFFDSSLNKFIFVIALFFLWEAFQVYRENNIKKYLDFKRELNDLENSDKLQLYITEREIENNIETN